MQKISKLIKLMIHQKQFFLYLFYITTVLFPKIEDRSIKIAIIVSSLPIIFILSLYIIFQVKNVKIDEEIFRVEAPFSSFSTLVYKLSEQLFTYKTNLNKKFEQSFMLTFIDAHFEKCELSNCLLAQKSVKINLFRQFNSSKIVTRLQIEGLFSIKLSKSYSFFLNSTNKDILTILN